VTGSLVIACWLLLAPQSATVAPDRAAARATLHEILSQRAFASARTDSWITSLRRRFEEWLVDLWRRRFGGRVAGRGFARGLAWIASIAAVIALLIWLGRMTLRARAEAPLAIGARAPQRRAGRDLALEAAALIDAGRTRDAARVAYRAAVHRLEEDGAFRVDETRTPREYLRLLPPPHRRRAPLASLTAAFERLWYGSRVASEEDGRQIVALLQELECLSPDRAN
jgi:hypothetical protein